MMKKLNKIKQACTITKQPVNRSDFEKGRKCFQFQTSQGMNGKNRSARGMKNPLVGGKHNPTDIIIEEKTEPSSGFH